MSDTISQTPQAAYGALKRRVTALRKAVVDYDRDTAELKRIAVRKDGAGAWRAVDRKRSAGYARLREKLRVAEHRLAECKPQKRAIVDIPFSQMLGKTLADRKKGFCA
jgi:hypothetical protein